MSSVPTRKTQTDTLLQSRRRATQLARLRGGMIAAANRKGYSNASVSAVIEEAGVSRPTFYDYFEHREACFVDTVKYVQGELMNVASTALDEAPGEMALEAAVTAIVAFATERPADARFLTKEALAGGPAALDARDAGIGEFARTIDKRLSSAPHGVEIPDVPLAAALGATYRMLALRLRRGEQSLAGLDERLCEWLRSYRTSATKQLWRVVKPLPLPEQSPYLMPPAMRPPTPLGPGRQKLSKHEITENHRERIMFATARAVQEDGYNAVTVARIMKLAGLDGRAFYRLFSDKQDAFTAIHELGFQYLMSGTAGAFFAGDSWPERMWEGLRAATQSIDDTPSFAHLGFVEAYAVGPVAIQRVEDSRVAFEIFLQEGYRDPDVLNPPPTRIALEATVSAIFEIVYRAARSSSTPETASLLGHLLHIALTPFIGPSASNAFLASKSAVPGGAPKPRRRAALPRSR
ncbi:MAG TPA: TetR/AcrR family transcriptional regulator [Solirubrobacteraceae bacterium]|jgi:AcrR family transcriptional regulator|nr:TetR/AcrR family transcriptional regulator [Solirubrobacteraceae bacterium]